MMSWNSFSQNVTDNNQIQLTKPVARLVIKDLIQFDGVSKEVESMQLILTETNNKLLVQGELVANLKTQISTYQRIIDEKDQQYLTQQELSKKLQAEVRKQKFKQKLVGGVGILVALGAVVIAN